ncbi:ABC transporter permease [Treponema sp. HNW]|uniref:ABC transporter permease n=1 Tax=Treponema sp. HNW TaxID=3116654 RepID=UPI003D0CFB2C
MGFLLAVQGAASQGILWGIMALGVFITFKVLDFPDLTVDGSFALGGAVGAVLVSHNADPLVSLAAAFIAGSFAGAVTALLHTKLKIPGILAGILTMIALYSVNIRIMGKANIPLLGVTTLMSRVADLTGAGKTLSSLISGIVFSAAIIALLYWFFGTELGSAIRATGTNEHMIRAQGVNTENMKLIGLALSNGLTALSGALVAQSQGYADVGMGVGAIVIGLASIIIGEVIFGHRIAFWYTLAGVVLGSITYRIIIALVLQLGMKSTDLKLLTACLVALSLAIPVVKANYMQKKQFKMRQKGGTLC